jgi:hypothetical protein
MYVWFWPTLYIYPHNTPCKPPQWQRKCHHNDTKNVNTMTEKMSPQWQRRCHHNDREDITTMTQKMSRLQSHFWYVWRTTNTIEFEASFYLPRALVHLCFCHSLNMHRKHTCKNKWDRPDLSMPSNCHVPLYTLPLSSPGLHQPSIQTWLTFQPRLNYTN